MYVNGKPHPKPQPKFIYGFYQTTCRLHVPVKIDKFHPKFDNHDLVGGFEMCNVLLGDPGMCDKV